MNVEKLDKKGLRKMADDLGVKWDKRIDDEASLRKKISASLKASESAPEAAENTDFDVSKRSPTETVKDPKTGKMVKVPVACFGWFFNPKPEPGRVNCKQDCPHWKPCSKLSAAAADALAELEAEEAASAEAEAVDSSDVELANAATERKNKKASKESITKGEKRKNAPMDEETVFTIAYDFDWALTVEDADIRKFYKRVIKTYGEKGKVTAGQLIDVFAEVVGLDDRDAILTEMLPEMVANGDFERA